MSDHVQAKPFPRDRGGEQREPATYELRRQPGGSTGWLWALIAAVVLVPVACFGSLVLLGAFFYVGLRPTPVAPAPAAPPVQVVAEPDADDPPKVVPKQ